MGTALAALLAASVPALADSSAPAPRPRARWTADCAEHFRHARDQVARRYRDFRGVEIAVSPGDEYTGPAVVFKAELEDGQWWASVGERGPGEPPDEEPGRGWQDYGDGSADEEGGEGDADPGQPISAPAAEDADFDAPAAALPVDCPPEAPRYERRVVEPRFAEVRSWSRSGARWRTFRRAFRRAANACLTTPR